MASPWHRRALLTFALCVLAASSCTTHEDGGRTGPRQAGTPRPASPTPPPDAAVGLADEETAEEREQRRERVAERRASGLLIIAHRGALDDGAHEHTMEAYRATFELGADGNDLDVRRTADGVLVTFHDDILDKQLLGAYGDVSDKTFAELASYPFRHPGRYGAHTRIPTLREVLLLHRRFAGLIELDVKQPGIEPDLIALLDELDMWDHVITTRAEALRSHPRYPRSQPAPLSALYDGRREADPEAIAAVLSSGPGYVTADHVAGVIVESGRPLGRVSREPEPAPAGPPGVNLPAHPSPLAVLLETLNDAPDWNVVAPAGDAEQASASRILARAQAADQLAALGAADAGSARSAEVQAALARRVRERSAHRHWRYQGLDGDKALRAMLELQLPGSVELARLSLYRPEPPPEPEAYFLDWQVKTVVFDALPGFPSDEAVALCRELLARDEAGLSRVAAQQFEPAALALLAMRPSLEVALELLAHPRPDVRGATVVALLRLTEDQPWAREALERAAPHALRWQLTRR